MKHETENELRFVLADTRVVMIKKGDIISADDRIEKEPWNFLSD